MTSNRPYLLRAFYDWIVDNDCTPYLVVDAMTPGTEVPQEHVKDGQIVLNIAPSACNNMHMGQIDLTFEARFGGVPQRLVVPMTAVMAIYARENGAGTIFTHEDDDPEPPTDKPPKESAGQPPKGRPSLKIVK